MHEASSFHLHLSYSSWAAVMASRVTEESLVSASAVYMDSLPVYMSRTLLAGKIILRLSVIEFQFRFCSTVSWNRDFGFEFDNRNINNNEPKTVLGFGFVLVLSQM